MRLVGFITVPASVRLIRETGREPLIALAIAPARSPPATVNGQELVGLEDECDAIPGIDFE